MGGETLFTYEQLLTKIRNDEPFAFSRWGDGEWAAILGHKGHNCDGHEYFNDLGEALREVLDERQNTSLENYYLGMQGLAVRRYGEEIRTKYNIDWCDADIIHRASIKGKLDKFFEVLKDRRIILVGPKYLKDIKVIEFDEFIEIPEKNCWLEFEKIRKEIGELIYKLYLGDSNVPIILFCASMMANVLIDELIYPSFIFIDIGSVFDPYVGKHTRVYHKNLNIK